MATYLELAQLASDVQFLARVTYAIGKYAAYISNESAGTANHAARLNWTLRAGANMEAMTRTLVGPVTRDENVVADLGGVTDVNLQSAVETAANTLIATPISYLDLITLAADQVFLRRVQVAVAKFANYCLNESPNTANHPARYNWAKNAIVNTAGAAFSLAPAIVLDTNVAANLFGSTDAQIQSATEVEIAQLML